ncbi:hypothetical protein MTO96_030676 [Rhipicephalus appendiculatus]
MAHFKKSFKESLSSVSPGTVRRIGRACFLRLVLPLAAWILIYVVVVRHGSVYERTIVTSVAAVDVLPLCDRFCDPQRVWGTQATVETFKLPDTRQESVWKMEVSGGLPVDGFRLFSGSFSVRLTEPRRCEVIRDAVYCVGHTIFCLRSVVNTTLEPLQPAGVNVTEVVRLSMPLSVALWYTERAMRAHEKMLRKSLED